MPSAEEHNRLAFLNLLIMHRSRVILALKSETMNQTFQHRVGKSEQTICAEDRHCDKLSLSMAMAPHVFYSELKRGKRSFTTHNMTIRYYGSITNFLLWANDNFLKIY
jgi:hypothetical protein